MTEIPVLRMHIERMKKDKFVALARQLGLRGDPVVTDEALFVQDKQRALAYAMPGSRFGGLLFFTDTAQGIVTPVGRVPGDKVVEDWTTQMLKRFQLLPRPTADKQIRASFDCRVIRRESVVEEGQEARKIRRVPLATEIVFDVRVNEYHVTGPRARVRLAFKNAKGPMWVHRGVWERLDVFESRPLFAEDEVYRRLADRLNTRGSARKPWRMVSMRLAYFAGEFCGGPDLLLPYYFAEVEFRGPGDEAQDRQGPRQLIQLPACA
ncbi:MAG: hypothetical protein PVJ57_15510 [Phycisphaerae bacterium]